MVVAFGHVVDDSLSDFCIKLQGSPATVGRGARLAGMRAVVLAGGLGIRLRSRVSDVPKPMARIAGRPFLEYLLEHLVRCGFLDVTLAIGYRAETVVSHFGKSWRGARLRYVIENEPLGTGGALLNALQKSDADPFLAINGDTYFHIDYAVLVDWYRRHPCLIAIALRSVVDVSRYGAVRVEDGRVVAFVEKGNKGPGLVNAGVYVIQPEVLRALSPGRSFSFERDVLQKHCATLSPRAFVADGFFIDIGEPDDFERAQRELPDWVNENEPNVSRNQ